MLWCVGRVLCEKSKQRLSGRLVFQPIRRLFNIAAQIFLKQGCCLVLRLILEMINIRFYGEAEMVPAAIVFFRIKGFINS